MTERYHLQILDIQPKGVKVHGPLTPSLAVDFLTKLFKEQPLGLVGENTRVYVVDLETGKITKPSLKLQI